jgi:hypothetical protein
MDSVPRFVTLPLLIGWSRNQFSIDSDAIGCGSLVRFLLGLINSQVQAVDCSLQMQIILVMLSFAARAGYDKYAESRFSARVKSGPSLGRLLCASFGDRRRHERDFLHVEDGIAWRRPLGAHLGYRTRPDGDGHGGIPASRGRSALATFPAA